MPFILVLADMLCVLVFDQDNDYSYDAQIPQILSIHMISLICNLEKIKLESS